MQAELLRIRNLFDRNNNIVMKWTPLQEQQLSSQSALKIRSNMCLRLTRFPVLFSSIISAISIIFLNIFGSKIFHINDVHDYRKGNRERQLSTYLQFIAIGTILWLILGHATLFLYFIPDLLPHSLVILSFLSIGLWYHIVIPLFILTVLATVISVLKALIICHPITKCFSKFSILEAICLNRNVQTAVTLLIGIFLCLFSYFFCDTLTVKNISLNVKDLPDGAKAIRFALISDIHAGATVFEEEVERIVDRVNSQAVDAVFIVGDVVDAPKDSIENRVRPLRQVLKSKTFYVSGNHEYYYGNASEWFDLFEHYGFEVLNNRHVLFRGICLAGVSDYSSGKSGLPNHKFEPIEALNGCPQNSTTIVLSHNPTSAKEIAFNDAHLRVDLILSGHTHAGQFYTVAPIAYWMMPYYYGLYQISPETQLFVTAGTLYQEHL
ncbi:hypothetical protein DINM_006756 [Dirofilaria immitis]|nr:hypothetical protein [Dirofilaria immitis]